MINRLFLQSIAFRLPFAIVFICSSVFILSAVGIAYVDKLSNDSTAQAKHAKSH